MSDRTQHGYFPSSIDRTGTHGQQNAFRAAYNSDQTSPPMNWHSGPSVPANTATPHTNPSIPYATEQDARQGVVQPTGATIYAQIPSSQALPTTQTSQDTGHAQYSHGSSSAQATGSTSASDPGGIHLIFSLNEDGSSTDSGQRTNRRPCVQCQKAQSRCNVSPPFSSQECERCQGRRDRCRFHPA